MTSRQFGHEGDAGFLHALAEHLHLRGVDWKRDRRVDRLAEVAGGQDRRAAIPLIGEVEDGVDVIA